jgi:glycosyltransferase involved in cell wall biosynthesis
MLHRAAVFFLPSYTEAMPMSILEAMGYGLPVVSTNVGGIPQLVQQEENGYLCQPGDVQSFADALIRLLQDPQLREEMGKRSLDIVQTGFSLKAHTDGIERVYEEILSPESNKGANRHAPI